MSAVAVETTSPDANVLGKLNWKIPITFGFASLLLLFFAMEAQGQTRIRLNDKSQAFNIGDFSFNASAVLWAFFAIALLGTVWSVLSVLSRGKYAKAGRILDVTAMVAIALMTILGFMIFAGAGSESAVTVTSTLVSTIAISTPLIFGALSGVVCERVGVVNIAIEGQLLFGAFAGVVAASFFKNAYVGLLAAPLAGAFVGCLLALFSVKYGVDQIIVGVVLNVLVLGLTTFFAGTLLSHNAKMLNTNQYSLTPVRIPLLADIPVIGPALFNQSVLVYCMYIAVTLLTIFLFRSRWGLRLRACGEHPRAADTVGINVNRTRFRNTVFGSSLAGLGGAFFTIGSGLAFTDNMSAGNGYIALAAMILGKWHPLGAVAASVMFGFAKAFALLVPNLTNAIPSQMVNMIPYVVTIIAVAGFVGKSRAPAAENVPYVK
ncbi:simple sugar transport system permease protein [Arcanobacterium pluranimalium]|uniref:ABC transporter permease n=1 Tax=Arcanobacterium pluranimalium TaxID=108028 RepID=UPI00195CD214|nr:ABC transporter permease [Arcanobacterium pluranimalium]MBM7825068.1 simple sugar transport system permease protein [Arcanobacterium pluranimalium]